MTPLRQQVINGMRHAWLCRAHTMQLPVGSTGAGTLPPAFPGELGVPDLEQYYRHLALERELSGSTCRLHWNAIRFLNLKVLQWSALDVPLVVPKHAQRIPELLTRNEVARIPDSCANPKHRMLLKISCGCGLRVSEVVGLRVRQIDGERRLLRVEQGKGAEECRAARGRAT